MSEAVMHTCSTSFGFGPEARVFTKGFGLVKRKTSRLYEMRGGRAIRVCDLKYKGNLHPKTGHLKILRSPRLCLIDIQMFRTHVIIWMIQDWQLSSIRNTQSQDEVEFLG